VEWVGIFKVEAVAALVNRGSGKWSHRAGVMPGKAEIVLSADAVQNMRPIGCTVDKSRVSASMVVTGVVEVNSDEQAASVDVSYRILTVTFRFCL
jgi:hypothetical protein